MRLGRAKISFVRRIDNRDPRLRIQDVGGMSGKRWLIPSAKAIELIEQGTWGFYVEIDDIERKVLVDATGDGTKYLRTSLDSASPDSLLALPDCDVTEAISPERPYLLDPAVVEVPDSLPDGLSANMNAATDLFRTLSHSGRLMIACHLLSGPKSVTELAELLELPQMKTSVLLGTMRFAGIVSGQRDGKLIRYSLSDLRVARIITCLHEAFCGKRGEE